MKKSIWIILLMSIPMMSTAQITWETPEEAKAEAKAEEQQKVNPDLKYLEGAVPVIDGKVVFRKTFDAPGKTAFQIYNIVGKYLQDVTKEENQINSKIVDADTTTYKIDVFYEEWLVFSSSSLALDRTRFYYTIEAICENGKVTVDMSHIRYLYNEHRNPQRMKAEEWIVDEESLNNKKTKLLPNKGKFRRKTIDRKDILFENLEKLLK